MPHERERSTPRRGQLPLAGLPEVAVVKREATFADGFRTPYYIVSIIDGDRTLESPAQRSLAHAEELADLFRVLLERGGT